MNTTNLISTPNITGNIGSCEVKSVETPIKAGSPISVTQVTLVNSCTGEVIKQYEYKDYTGAWFMGAISIIVIGGFIVAAISVWLESKN